MKRDYASTVVTELVVMGCSLLVYRIAARRFGEAGFGEYAIARRTISLIQLPLLLGLSLSVTRHVAVVVGTSSSRRDEIGGYLWVTIATGGAAALLFAVSCVPFASRYAQLAFGDSRYAYLLGPMGLVVAGLSLHGLIYGYFRGNAQMPEANALQFVNNAVIPLAVFWRAPSPQRAFLLLGIGVLAIAGLATAVALIRVGIPRMPLHQWRGYARRLLGYGVIRVPGEFAWTALLALPVNLYAHAVGVTQAGYLAFAVAMLSAFGGLFAPLGHILLPAIGRMMAGQEYAAARRHVWRLMIGCTGMAMVGTVFVEALAGFGIRAFLAPSYWPAAAFVRILFICAIPYVTYIVLRAVLDAVYVRPWNTIHLVAAIAVEIGVMSLFPRLRLACLPIAIGLLGTLTAYRTIIALRGDRDRAEAEPLAEPVKVGK